MHSNLGWNKIDNASDTYQRTKVMKLQQSTPTNTVQSETAQNQALAMPELKERTFGQKLADKMAAKVGSWAFLIGQSTVLAAWVGCNLTPGLPHWDESPFILLNLVFSFASAYTAPVVLMSQNRQSDEDRAHAQQNYQVNLQTAQNLELLQQKMDQMYSQKLSELTELIQQTQQQAQQQAESAKLNQVQIPNYIGLLPNYVAQSQVAQSQSVVLPMVESPLFIQPAPDQNFDSHIPEQN
jgi:uncharacterized membrane protein